MVTFILEENMADNFVLNESISFSKVVNELINLPGAIFTSPETKDNWIEELNELITTYNDFSSFAHEFDYSSNVKYNGFRSFMKMVKSYFTQLSKTIKAIEENPMKKLEIVEKLRAYESQSFPFLSMARSMQRVKMNYSKSQTGDTNDQEFIQGAMESLIQSSLELTQEKLLGYTHSSFFFFWLPKWFRSVVYFITMLVYFFSNPIWNLFRFYSTVNLNKFYANHIVQATIFLEINNINKLFNSWMLKFIIKISSYWYYSDIEISQITLNQRQDDWLINQHSRTVEKCNNNTPCDQKSVKCILLKPRKFTSDNLIVFIHGGGFITMTAESYVPALQPLVRVTGATVVNIEYSLSPQVKYPVALQECLDVYLNLVSSNPFIGFNPKKIILMGDSAGGNLATAMSIILAEIREKQISSGEVLTSLPNGLNLIYPLASPCIGHLFSSRAFIDFLMFPKMYFLFSNAYSGPLDEEKYFKDNKKIWHKDETTLRYVSSKINSKFNDPFFHLLSYGHFDRLKSVPLYVQVSEFDPCLDDSIALCKCWKGPMKLDVIPDVSHGWMTFEPFASKDFQGGKILRKRAKEALKREVSFQTNNNNNNNNKD